MAALRALPDGSIYIVSTGAEIEYCKRLLEHMGRSPDCLRIIPLSRLRDAERYRRSTVFDVDHAIYEWGMAGASQRHWLRILQQRYVVPQKIPDRNKIDTAEREPNRPNMPLR
jgi:hypothetical protein